VIRDGRMVDAFSGTRAIHLPVDSLELHEVGRATAAGGFACGPLCGSGATYTLEHRLGRWEVTDEHFRWIS
jgi:hypothetical protein